MSLTITHTWKCHYCGYQETADQELHPPWSEQNQPFHVPLNWSVVNFNLVCPNHRVRIDPREEPAPPPETSNTLTAGTLISILQQHQSAGIEIVWDEHIEYSELTGETETQHAPVHAVYLDGSGRIVLSADAYISGYRKLWVTEQTP